MKIHAILLAIAVSLSGCISEKNTEPNDENVQETVDSAVDETPTQESVQEPISEAVVEFQIELLGTPIHVEGKPVDGGTQLKWTVVLEDGTVQRFVTDGQTGKVNEPTEGKNAEALASFIKPSSEMTIQTDIPQPTDKIDITPLQVNEGEFIYVNQSGDVVFWKDGQELKRIAVNALPDTNLMMDDQNRILVLTQPSNRYDHGIFGDQVEASGFAIIDATTKNLVQEAVVAQKDVIESLQALWIDWDQDGTKEIILTLSNNETGARLAVVDETGKLLAEGEPLGQNHRWRHALTVGAFSSTGKLELAEITTPHIGGNLQFVEWNQQSKKLNVTAAGAEYSTHFIGSKNLDIHTSFDSNFDGQLELWVPNQRKNALIGIQRTAEGFEPIDQVELQGTLSSNVVSIASNAQAVLAAGTDKATLEIRMFNR